MKPHLTLFFVTCWLFAMTTATAQSLPAGMKSIELAGLIIDAETLKPIAHATIDDGSGAAPATSDSEGYFTMSLPDQGGEEIRFRLKIQKEGYEPLVEQEHWGRTGKAGAVFYFGLRPRKSSLDSFSEMPTDLTDTSFPNVKKNFESVKEEVMLENKIANAKKGNEHVFFEIDHTFFLVNESGWIKLATREDKISIDGTKVVPASQLNTIVKRKKVKGMTPVVSEEAVVRIRTI